jgi:hypothetical protein
MAAETKQMISAYRARTMQTITGTMIIVGLLMGFFAWISVRSPTVRAACLFNAAIRLPTSAAPSSRDRSAVNI